MGDRAGVEPIWDVCGSCEQCWDDKECCCPSAVVTGLTQTGKHILETGSETFRDIDG